MTAIFSGFYGNWNDSHVVSQTLVLDRKLLFDGPMETFELIDLGAGARNGEPGQLMPVVLAPEN